MGQRHAGGDMRARAHDILGRAHVGVLEDFARSKVLLAFDFDGTLAPIVAEPDRAAMRPRTRALLQAAAELFPIAVISGRAQTDLAARLRGVGAAAIVGNHGLESWHVSGARLVQVRGWLPTLSAAIAPLKGVTLEDKSYSVAVHYRQSRQKKLARDRVLDAARALPEVRVITGKQVINLLPRDAPHKGMALERERDRLGCDTAIYVGDDQADEDVFALDQPGRLLGIRVGLGRGSAAAYGITDQRAIDRLLRSLLRVGHSRRLAQPRREGAR